MAYGSAPSAGLPLGAAEIEKLFAEAGYEAAVALFSAYDVALRPADVKEVAYQQSGELNLISVIGFAGQHMRGSLVLGATDEPLELSMPRGSTQRDWIAELANQLLGRVKMRLMRRGIEFYAMPPAVVSGEHLTPVTSRVGFDPILFATPHGVVCLWIEVAVVSEVRPDPELLAADIPNEGDVILF